MIQKLRSVAVPVLGIVLALLAICFLSAPEAKATDGEKEVVGVVDLNGAKTPDELTNRMLDTDETTVVDSDDYTSEDSTLKKTDTATTQATRPAKFDLRNATFRGNTGSFVTNVKMQNPWGTCWSFGSNAAAESSILSEYGTPFVDGAEDALNLSEKHTAWFSFRPVEQGSQAGEGLYTNGSDTGDVYNAGGFISTASSMWASGAGPIDESYATSLEYHNAAGDYDDPLQMSNGAKVVLPSASGDWSIPEELHYVNSGELEESYYLPSPASWEPTDDPTKQVYVFNQQGVDAIKDQLLAGRGVAIMYHADQWMPNQSPDNKYLRSDTVAQYTYEFYNEDTTKDPQNPVRENHAVCIVGYDDTYPRTNFMEGHEPPGDGAFIVKNSWGALNALKDTDRGSFGGAITDGYFYLSYYDKSLKSPEAFNFITPYDNLQYGTSGEDYEAFTCTYAFLPNDPTGMVNDEVTSYANIFPMVSDSVVRSVSTQTFSFNSQTRFDLYLLEADAENPTDGELVWSHDEFFPYGGYHRVEVDKPIVAKAGQMLGLVCTSELSNGYYEVVNNQVANHLSAQMQMPNAEGLKWGQGVVNEGESYIGQPTKRVDYADGSYDYAGYTWQDYTEIVDEGEAKGNALIEDSGVKDLIAERDAVNATLTAMAPDDPAYAETVAQFSELNAQVYAIASQLNAMDGGRYAMYAQDNFPLIVSIEAYDPENPPAEAGTVDTYRLYNRWTGEHLFTQSASERASLKAAGWTDEGKAWTSPSKSNAPVYRLFNPYTGEHLYTTSRTEKDTLSQGGWNYEGIAWYSDPAREGAVFRLYNPSATTFTHHFTADLKERDSLLRSGWRFEGVAWYGAPETA